MERLLLEFVVRTTLIAAVTGVALWALRIRTAAAKHGAWAGVLTVMLLLPAWLEWGPKASLPVLPARPAEVVSYAPASEVLDAIETAPVATAKTSSPAWSGFQVFLDVYLLGASVLLLRLIIGTLRARRLTSGDCAAPVTVGLFRPRIILPESAGQWSQAQLDAVLTHEREHARRRDPLFQWVALFNRAVFWFHPLAWWLEQRISALAEEACDAAVLERGHDPREYSRYLLELARAVQRAGTRVNVVAMAMPGSYLPYRVKNIVAGVRAPKISRARLACAVVACAIPGALFAAGTLDHAPQLLPLWPLPARPLPLPPVMIAQATPPAPVAPAKLGFEVASVRQEPPSAGPMMRGMRGGPGTDDPTRISYSAVSMQGLLMLAYDLPMDQISGPSWLSTERYSIDAKVPPGTTREQLRGMLQHLLAERFHLTAHSVKQDFEAYEMTVAKGGLKMKESVVNPNGPTGREPNGMPTIVPLTFKEGFPVLAPGNTPASWGIDVKERMLYTARQEDMVWMVRTLQNAIGRGVRIVDKTGLTGKYDFHVQWALPSNSGGTAAQNLPAGADYLDSIAEPAPDVITAAREQLGLALTKAKVAMNVLVIDHVDKIPVEN